MRLLLAAVLSLALGGLARAQPANPVPQVDIHQRVLANGLKVFTVLDRKAPNVTVQVWYDVGSKDDPPGRSGFAHLFEHLMFKGARDMPPEFLDRLTEDVGGENNASTADDYTEYHETIPPNHLQRLLWAEAERMGGLVVDEANFKSEREVVEEELRQRVLADPYGRLYELGIPEASFIIHPYHRPPIGGIADLDAATLDDVRAFHATYYRPDNANLIVVGNFDPAQLDAWIDKYFGPIARPDAPIPRVGVVEPPRTEAKSYDLYAPDVPLPAVVLTFPAPASISRDATVLQVIDAILTTGESSRLYQSLVYRQQLADSVMSQADLRQQPGLFEVGAVMAAGKTPEDGEAALRAELARLRDTPVSPAELERARNQLLSSFLRNRETVEGRGAEIGATIALEGDAQRVNSDIVELEGITIDDIQRVARQYLRDDQRVTLRYRDDSQKPAGWVDPLVQDSPQVVADPLPRLASIPVVALAPPDQRQAPPPPAPPAPMPAPHAVARTLPNGLQVIVARTSDLPVVTAELALRGGAAFDPPGEAGLSSLTVALAAKGANGRSATDIAQAVETLGGQLSTQAGHDSASVVFTGLAASLPQALPILADVARHPTFAPDELERLRKQKLDEFSLALQDPATLASMAAARVVFGAGPDGHVADGTVRSLGRITRADVLAQHQVFYRPDEAVLVLTGGIDPEAGFALAEQAFGGWARPAGAAPVQPSDPPLPGHRVVVVDLPGAGQAAVTVAGRSIARLDPDYYPVEVADEVLGGGYSARLNEEIRVKRGLSYGARANVDERRLGGLFTASVQTRNDAAVEVADLVLKEIDRLDAAAPAAPELTARETSMIGETSRSLDTSAGLAGVLADNAVEGVPLDDVARYADAVRAVGADAVPRAAARMVDPAQADVIIVGDAKAFAAALKQRFPDAQVIPGDKLDLDSPGLEAVSAPGTPPGSP